MKSDSSELSMPVTTTYSGSPEAFTGHKDFRSDIYSVAAVMFKLATGLPARDLTEEHVHEAMKIKLTKGVLGDPSIARRISVLFDDPRTERLSDFGPRFRSWLDKCLASDARKRYRSAAEALIGLNDAYSQFTLIAEHQKYRRPPWHFTPRDFVMASLPGIAISIKCGKSLYLESFTKSLLFSVASSCVLFYLMLWIIEMRYRRYESESVAAVDQADIVNLNNARNVLTGRVARSESSKAVVD
jgi:serine/threonine protein kinase